MFELTKIRDGVFHLLFNSRRELGMTFVRYQEFYENINDKIRGKQFTLVEHMGHYIRDMNDDENADWTYPSDWAGFNIPADVIKQVNDLGIKDPNCYDSLMLGIYGLAMMNTKGERAYIIGSYKARNVSAEDQDEENLNAEMTRDHELTHAMFYIEEDYREKVLSIINKAPKALKEALVTRLNEIGYPEKVAFDEVNAYITTGDHGYFDDVAKRYPKTYKTMKSNLIKMHKKVFNKWKNGENVRF